MSAPCRNTVLCEYRLFTPEELRNVLEETRETLMQYARACLRARLAVHRAAFDVKIFSLFQTVF